MRRKSPTVNVQEWHTQTGGTWVHYVGGKGVSHKKQTAQYEGHLVNKPVEKRRAKGGEDDRAPDEITSSKKKKSAKH